MSRHVVTWKKIADEANELFPKPSRFHHLTSPPPEPKIEYISGAVKSESTLQTNQSSFRHNSAKKLPLQKRIQNAYAKVYFKKATAMQRGIPHRDDIFDEFRMSRSKIDISRFVRDKDELNR